MPPTVSPGSPLQSRLKRAYRFVTRRRALLLRSTSPHSDHYGHDRGSPIDRFFIADFLSKHAQDVRGHALEVQDSGLTDEFGGDRVERRDVLDIDPSNPNATIVADLAAADALPAERFDCFILTQTLQYVSDLEAALRNAYASLKPGGTLLVTIPTISRIDPGYRDKDRWRITPTGLSLLIESSCPGARVESSSYGNVMSAAAFLYGFAVHEMSETRLLERDPDFPILACARVAKP